MTKKCPACNSPIKYNVEVNLLMSNCHHDFIIHKHKYPSFYADMWDYINDIKFSITFNDTSKIIFLRKNNAFIVPFSMLSTYEYNKILDKLKIMLLFS